MLPIVPQATDQNQCGVGFVDDAGWNGSRSSLLRTICGLGRDRVHTAAPFSPSSTTPEGPWAPVTARSMGTTLEGIHRPVRHAISAECPLGIVAPRQFTSGAGAKRIGASVV